MFSLSTIAAVGSVIVSIGAIARLFFWWRGSKSTQNKIDKKDAEILKKQRDNDVHSVDDADDFWLRIRNRK